jgi:hypothetical protein
MVTQASGFEQALSNLDLLGITLVLPSRKPMPLQCLLRHRTNFQFKKFRNVVSDIYILPPE